VPREIVSNRDPKFTSSFWKGLFKGFGINLNLSTSYHLESYGKIERNNRIIEDMLRRYVMDQPSKWENYIHLGEFSNKNGYQDSLKMSPF
jgi:transposase InsO family protein